MRSNVDKIAKNFSVWLHFLSSHAGWIEMKFLSDDNHVSKTLTNYRNGDSLTFDEEEISFIQS